MMISLEKLYFLKEKTPNLIKKCFPNFLRRKINKIFFQYYFLETNLKELPKLNYPSSENLLYQKNLIKKFDITNYQNSFMTCPHLIELLLMKFKVEERLDFLDIGGENIDFFLSLNNKFKNLNYFLFNQPSINNTFKKIKSEYNFENLNIIDNLKKILQKRYDFINFGSCIQYFNEYEEFLKKISNNSKCIFFSGTHLYESPHVQFDKKFVVKQMNVLPQINFLYFFNRSKFFEILIKKNFELMFEKKNLTDKVNYENFRRNLQNISYSDFLFLKK